MFNLPGPPTPTSNFPEEFQIASLPPTVAVDVAVGCPMIPSTQLITAPSIKERVPPETWKLAELSQWTLPTSSAELPELNCPITPLILETMAPLETVSMPRPL